LAVGEKKGGVSEDPALNETPSIFRLKAEAT
jgi:hypothetical protein